MIAKYTAKCYWCGTTIVANQDQIGKAPDGWVHDNCLAAINKTMNHYQGYG